MILCVCTLFENKMFHPLIICNRIFVWVSRLECKTEVGFLKLILVKKCGKIITIIYIITRFIVKLSTLASCNNQIWVASSELAIIHRTAASFENLNNWGTVQSFEANFLQYQLIVIRTESNSHFVQFEFARFDFEL